MEIHISNLCETNVKVSDIKKIIRKIVKKEAENSGSVNIVFCSDKKILELNRRFRQISKPTDVLSFPFRDSDLLGEIYISLETAERQAKEFAWSLDKEVIRLIVHGTVHLIGYDHKKKSDRKKMEAIEAKYV